MSQSHFMNPDHIQCLCSQLDLGTPSGRVSRVYGGFHHKMWRLQTTRHTYAVKQLSVDTNLRDPDTIDHYNVSEEIADAFSSHGISAIAALQGNTGYLQIIENTGYLVYPWSNAHALDRKQIDETHALKIARLLAKMHRANIVVPGAKATQFDIQPAETITALVHRASDCHILCTKSLNEQLQNFIDISASYSAAAQILEKHLLVGHGDMDQKNVLWDAMINPVVIDWESARELNPTYELINAALDWSGVASNFNPDLFGKILSAYQQADGVIEGDSLQASFHCILGDWLIWLLYIVALSLDEEDPEQRAIEAEQIDFVLPTLLRLKHLMPELLSIARGIACA